MSQRKQSRRDFLGASAGVAAVASVLADPPRAGLGKPVVKELERLAPLRVTIVSCDPATLARDLRRLPNYVLERVQPVDLFPQTSHVETVALLKRLS